MRRGGQPNGSLMLFARNAEIFASTCQFPQCYQSEEAMSTQDKRRIQLQHVYLQRNLNAIDVLIASGASLSGLKTHYWHKLLVISELHRQQSILLNTTTHRFPDSIVNLIQRQVRPIVRGKARAAVEFDAKISVSVRNRFALLHRISWDPYNEPVDLIPQAKNRNFCTRNNIRLSGKRLGRSPKDPEIDAAHKQQLAQTSEGDTRWKDALNQESESIILT